MHLVGHEGCAIYELLHLNETVNSNCYSQQLIRLNQEIERNRPFTDKEKRPVKLLHDNARPHVDKPVKETLLALGWEVLSHPAYSRF